MTDVFDDHRCTLGEGPLWHPTRQSLIWFDILNKTMFERRGDARQVWQFDEHVSAAGWMDDTTVLMASSKGLWQMDLTTGQRDLIVPLEAENPVTRSNDGRGDPWGGFWIGTMGLNAERKAGAIYRYHEGALRQIVGEITISNSICFAPDRSCAYYTDTVTQQVMRLPLAADSGWPEGPPEVFIDLKPAGQNPDGAVTDAEGNLWIALWGAGKVTCYDASGTHLRDLDVDARQPTCPSFGGPEFRDLLITSAATELEGDPAPCNGMVLRHGNVAQGVPEPQVKL